MAKMIFCGCHTHDFVQIFATPGNTFTTLYHNIFYQHCRQRVVKTIGSSKCAEMMQVCIQAIYQIFSKMQDSSKCAAFMNTITTLFASFLVFLVLGNIYIVTEHSWCYSYSRKNRLQNVVTTSFHLSSGRKVSTCQSCHIICNSN